MAMLLVAPLAALATDVKVLSSMSKANSYALKDGTIYKINQDVSITATTGGIGRNRRTRRGRLSASVQQ